MGRQRFGHRRTISPRAVEMPIARTPGSPPTTRTATSSPPSHTWSRPWSLATSIHASPFGSTRCSARARPGWRSSGPSQEMKNGRSGCSATRSNAALRHVRLRPSGRDRDPSVTATPRRSATPSISSVETHHATRWSPEREAFETHVPTGLDSASTGSATASSSTYSSPRGTTRFSVPHPGCRPPGRDPRPTSFRIRVPAASRSRTARTMWSIRSTRLLPGTPFYQPRCVDSPTMAARTPTAFVSLAIVALAAMPATAQPAVEPVAQDLAFPTNLAFAPDGRIFFTEKETGNVRIIRDGRVLPEPFVHVSVEGSAERGLLGIALDPDFERQPWVYLYYSEGGGASNRIIRLRAEAGEALEVDPIITLLPAVTGYLWETENGPASDDEVNRIVAAGNYGWPDQLGPGGEGRFIDPELDFERVMVATGCAVRSDGRWLYFGSYLNGLYRARLLPDGSLGGPELVPGVGTAVTDVARAPDGSISVATSYAILRLPGTPPGSPRPTGSPTSASPGPARGAGTGVGLVIAAVLIGGLILLRRRIVRR